VRTLGNAYEMIGYQRFWSSEWLETLRSIQLLRRALMDKIVAQHPAFVSIEDLGDDNALACGYEMDRSSL
jgi:hypothetical protein